MARDVAAADPWSNDLRRRNRTWDLAHRFDPPVHRNGIVVRQALVDRLLASDEPVVSVAAPPGYGKTSLLAQWGRQTGTAVAWVTCDRADDDPVAFWGTVLASVSRVSPVSDEASYLLAAPGGGVDAVPELIALLSEARQPVIVMLDGVEVMTSRNCWSSVAELLLRVPEGWQVAMSSRGSIPVPVARLRVQQRILELGPPELAMTQSEASQLIRGVGVELSEPEVVELVRRTEGWPAGLYLAALASKADPTSERARFTGTDRLMGDYFRSELLPPLTPQLRSFLLQTSILDRMCGPLCDAVTQGTGSASVLDELESRTLLVVPLDRKREWYRYHHLLREFLHGELRRDDPELPATLHTRAAAWYEENGLSEQAVEHAQLAGDADHVAVLVLNLMQPVWASGRIDTVQRWLEWLKDRRSVRHYSAVAAHASLIAALMGQPVVAERWAAAAESSPSDSTLPDGTKEAATLAYLRALLARDGPESMRLDAAAALDGMSPSSPYGATLLHTQALSYLLVGELDPADALFTRAFTHAVEVGSLPLAALVLAERAEVAIAGDDWPAAEALLARARDLVESGRFEGYWTSALVYAASARVATQLAKASDARIYVRLAAHLRPLLTYALPVVSTQALVELAHAYLSLADAPGARAVLEQARGIVQQRPGLGSLPDALAQLEERVDQMETAPAGGISSLTPAELRLLPLLRTHLTIKEMGDRLFLSPNTVKVQVSAIYRKLGVASRNEAVERMVELGLHR